MISPVLHDSNRSLRPEGLKEGNGDNNKMYRSTYSEKRLFREIDCGGPTLRVAIYMRGILLTNAIHAFLSSTPSTRDSFSTGKQLVKIRLTVAVQIVD